ncbi:TOBE domain-containing protein [Niveibacterium sp. SC-1]|uniref:TOBE domain-containing protein n=1 Tax=Niveibacterium sp. SC-1 TaxID=3135646 RepID=UPI00311E5A29
MSRFEVATEFGNFLGDTRIRLLEAIAEHGSISRAARHVPLSYKAAWDAVDTMNNLADQALVERATGGRQGGGTRLTDYGRRVIAMFRAVEREYQIAFDRLSQQLGGPDDSVEACQRLLRRMNLRISARNQFACSVTGLREGVVDYEVYLRMDAETNLVAIITRQSAEDLGLRIGSEVVALVKASCVLLTTDRDLRTSARNQLWGTVSRIHEGPVNAEVVVALGAGKHVTAVVTEESVQTLGLALGTPAGALIKSSDIILSVIG